MLKGLMLGALGITLAATPALAQTATPLVVAGGGGGGYITAGGNGQSGTAGGMTTGGHGGTNGAGGDGAGGGGGAGVSTGGGAGAFGVGGGMTGPGYTGGLGGNSSGNGGYGGGGGGSGYVYGGGGGGGGYSGGGGGGDSGTGTGGGGGGSYLDASLSAIGGLPSLNPGNTGSYATGANGFITITDQSTGVFQTFLYTGTVQSYTFATTAVYDIVAAGAQGGNFSNSFRLGGLGAVIGGEGSFTAGTTLSLIVGGGGAAAIGSVGGSGGGGGSFVFETYVAPAVITGALPEPGTWAMMIVGFGLVGGTMRRRRPTVSVA